MQQHSNTTCHDSLLTFFRDYGMVVRKESVTEKYVILPKSAHVNEIA